MRRTILALASVIAAACGGERKQEPPPSPAPRDAGAAPATPADAASTPRRALPAAPVSPDGPPLPFAAVTFGSPRYRMPENVLDLIEADGSLVALLPGGIVMRVDPATGELRQLGSAPISAAHMVTSGGRVLVVGTPGAQRAGDIEAVVWELRGEQLKPAIIDDPEVKLWGLDVLGSEVLAHGVLDSSLRILDATTGRTRARLTAFDGVDVLTARLLAGGKLLVYLDDRATVVGRDGRRPTPLPTNLYKEPWVSPDRRTLAFAAAKSVDPDALFDDTPDTVVVWDVARGRAVQRLALEAGLSAVAWLANGDVVTGDMDGHIIRWGRNGERVAEARLGSAMVWHLAAMSDGRIAVVAPYRSISIVDASLRPVSEPGPGHLAAPIDLVALGDRVLTVGFDDTMRVWDVNSGREVAVLRLSDGEVPLDATPVGADAVTLLSSADDVAVVETWSLLGERSRRVEWPADLTMFGEVEALPGGELLVVDRTAQWRLDASGAITSRTEHDSDRIAVGGTTVMRIARDATVAQLDGGAEIRTRKCARYVGSGAAASGAYVVVTDAAPTVGLWSSTGTLVSAIEPPGDASVMPAVGAEPPLVALHTDTGVLVWDVKGGVTMTLATGELETLTITDDGWLLGASANSRIGVWDLRALLASQLTMPAGRVGIVKQDCHR